MAGSDIATITVNGKESKMQVATLLSILNGAESRLIDIKIAEEDKTVGELVAQKGLEEENMRNALANFLHCEKELELIESIKTELEIDG